MGRYILRRLLLMIPTLWAIITVNFFIVQVAPGRTGGPGHRKCPGPGNEHGPAEAHGAGGSGGYPPGRRIRDREG